MSSPSNGITPEVIRDVMPPYHLSQDLLSATLLTIPAPPPNASESWRQARLTRLLQEIVDYHPADAVQAHIAAQILGIRVLADTITAQAHTGHPPLNELHRIARSTAELHRTATTLDRTLRAHQQNPVPFYGTVIQDEVDLKTLDAQWASRTQSAAATAVPTRSAAAPAPEQSPPTAPRPNREAPANASPPPTPPTETEPPPRAAADPAPPPPTPTPPHQPVAHIPPPTATQPAATTPLPETPPPPAPEAPPLTRPAAPGSDWSITRLDEGPGWSREVLRHRDATPQDVTR